MKHSTMLCLLLCLFSIGMSIFISNHPVKGVYVGAVTINPDGSISPPYPTGPIWTPDNVTYYVTEDIDGYILILRSHIILDGSGTTLTGSGSGNGIELNTMLPNKATQNVTIEDFKQIRSFTFGIQLNDLSNNTVRSNGITETYTGIITQNASHNVIEGNDIRYNILGVDQRDSTAGRIHANNITNSGSVGIQISSCNDCNITGNHIADNEQGLYVGESLNSYIYGNSFINNTIQVTATAHYGNFWDNGYPSGGNYWSDHANRDIKYGVNQNELGSDLIADKPYIISEENVDNFPKAHTPGTLHATYYLTILPSTGGTYNITEDPEPGTYHFTENIRLNLTAVPETCYQLDHWIYDSLPAGTNNPIQFVMDQNHTVQAIFTLMNYTLTINATPGGTTDPITGNHTYTCGANETVNATADPGYSFDHWLLNEEEQPDNETITVIMNSDHALLAVFIDDVPPLINNITREPSGDVTPDQNVTIRVDVSDLGSGVKNVTLSYTIDLWTHSNDTLMTYNDTLELYEAVIPNQTAGTIVFYKAAAFDIAENHNTSQAFCNTFEAKCRYHVIPEFQTLVLVPLFIIATLAITAVTRRDRALRRTYGKTPVS